MLFERCAASGLGNLSVRAPYCREGEGTAEKPTPIHRDPTLKPERMADLLQLGVSDVEQIHAKRERAASAPSPGRSRPACPQCRDLPAPALQHAVGSAEGSSSLPLNRWAIKCPHLRPTAKA